MQTPMNLGVCIFLFKKITILLSFLLCSTVYRIYDTGKGHRTDVSAAL